MHPYLISCALLASASAAQIPSAPSALLPNDATPTLGAWPFAGVLHDLGPDGTHWVRGATYKASFDAEGFAYVPALPGAPRNFPLRFRLAAVHAGGVALSIDPNAAPMRDGDRIVYDRGSVSEVYDLRTREVEQTFVVDAAIAGDVEIELAIESELVEDAGESGVQFVGPHGGVAYGEAFVLRDERKLSIPTTCNGRSIKLHVPAALRGAGALVVDPVLSTQAAATPASAVEPDVAYDVSNDCYLYVWEEAFSELDHDAFSVMYDAAGNLVPGSGAAIDATSTAVAHPRVANLNIANRFLVVFSAPDALNAQRQMIYGRVRDAGGSTALGPWFQISEPRLAGDNFSPEVGADPGTEPGDHDWLVVWANSLGSTQAGIQGRLVRSDGQHRSSQVLTIQPDGGARNWYVQVSRSNGNGEVAHPQWLVVYGRSSPTSGGNVYLRRVALDGTVDPELIIDASLNDDRFPQVSSPLNLGNGTTSFMIVYERPLAAMGVVARIGGGGQISAQFFNLEQLFQIGRYTPRVETDGIRYIATASRVNPFSSLADYTKVQTFEYSGSSLRLHDTGIVPGVVREPQLASRYNSGGRPGVIGIAHTQLVGFATQPALTLYAARATGPMFEALPTGCGLGIDVAGTSALGDEFQLTLSGFGSDLPCFAFGMPSVIPLPLCSGCSFGLRLDLPIATFIGSPSITMEVPPTLELVDVSFGMQGFSIGAGSCLGGLTFSDTLRITVR
ncbi:MAG: hypothetical protein JNM84_08050 [Planctomycetes bacterium]|nr:hypothetical protein [Planctomycetota bacterium]